MSRLAEFRDAMTDVAPAMVAAAPIGLLYGAVATTKGMSAAEVVLSSGLIFAGGAQLAALDLWTSPPPVLALVLSVLLINARYVLMSASIAPKLAHLPFGAKLLGFHALADENWALAERRAALCRVSGTYFFGMGAVFFANWMAWSWMGALVGPLLGDPRRLGADFAFIAIFIGLVMGFRAMPRWGLVVVVSAAASAAAYTVLGSPWHVLAGALTGIGAAVAAARPEEARP